MGPKGAIGSPGRDGMNGMDGMPGAPGHVIVIPVSLDVSYLLISMADFVMLLITL